MSKVILFYSSVSNKDLFQTQKFYLTDIKILEDLGYEVILSNSISDALKFWKYDVYFGYFFRYSFFPGLIARLLGKKVFFTGGIDALDRKYAGEKAFKLQVLFFWLCYIVSTKCIIVSHSDLKNIKSTLPRKKWDKLVLSEHTIEIDKFVNTQKKKKLFTTIGWQGNEGAIKRKGIDTALRIFSRLSKLDEFVDFNFIIIGKEGKGTVYVENLIKELDITQKVILTGEISEEEKIELLQQSEYYFQVSKFEGFGIAALEAFCANNILIHSKKGGLDNPIYSSNELIFNIDAPFDEAYSKFEKAILNFRKDNIRYNDALSYYSNTRRQMEFKNIL